MYYKNIEDYERLVDPSCFNTNETSAIEIYAAVLTLVRGLSCSLMLAQRSLFRVVKTFRK